LCLLAQGFITISKIGWQTAGQHICKKGRDESLQFVQGRRIVVAQSSVGDTRNPVYEHRTRARARVRCAQPSLVVWRIHTKSNWLCRIEAPPIMALQLLRMKHMRSNKTPAVRSTCALSSFHGNRQNTTVLLSELVADYGVLESVKCRCSQTKTIGIAFCDRCWSALPAFNQRALRSARAACGFATAYWAAAASLDSKSDRETRPYRPYQRRT
jgi:hypothetical protein